MLCAIPIEILNRELDGTLLVGLELAKRGLPTLFGERMVTQYVKKNDHPVIYVDIEQYAPMNSVVLARGGRVLNINAEGLAFLCDTKFISIFEHIKDNVSDICLWGDKQLSIVKEHLPQDMADVLKVTGYPSFDLASERFISYYRNDEIITEHGEDYILINANFGIYNHAMGLGNYLNMIQKMAEWDVYKDPEYLKWLEKQADYQEQVVEGFLEMVHQLTKAFPERHIIVRPHPTEDNGLYERALRQHHNVFVTNQGGAREWIASASHVIHHDCTTSMEALMMGKPVIQYRPVYDQEYNDPLLASIGSEAETVDLVIECIRAGSMPDELRREQLGKLAPYISNINKPASQVIADIAFGYASSEQETWIPEPLGLWDSFKCWRKHLSKVLRSKQPGHNGKKVSYALNKFPRLPLAEVQERVDKMCALDSSLPKVKVDQLALNTFLMQPE